MYCPECLKFINEADPDFCPHCGHNLKKKKKALGKPPKALGIIIGVIGVMIFLGSMPDSEPKLVSSSPASISTVTNSTTTFKVGDTAEMGGVRVTWNGLSESKGTEFLAPSAGNIFVNCEFTIENNTNSDLAVSSMMSFSAYFDDYAASLSISAMSLDDGKQQLDGNVAPGKKIRGVVGFEAPADWEEAEIHFIPDPLTANSFVFIASSESGQSSAPVDTGFKIPGTLVAENFDIKIISAEICESVTLDGGGADIPVEADDGKQFLVLSIDATNTSEEPRNLGSFLTYADSVAVFPNNYLGKYGERVVFVGAVQPGKTIGTYILYQVPTEWKEFELSYVDSLTSSVSKTIKIIRSDMNK